MRTIEKKKFLNVQSKLENKEAKKAVDITTVEEKPMKFLGSEVIAGNTPSAMFAAINLKLENRLKHRQQNKQLSVSPASIRGFSLVASNAQNPHETTKHPHKKIPECLARYSVEPDQEPEKTPRIPSK